MMDNLIMLKKDNPVTKVLDLVPDFQIPLSSALQQKLNQVKLSHPSEDELNKTAVGNVDLNQIKIETQTQNEQTSRESPLSTPKNS